MHYPALAVIRPAVPSEKPHLATPVSQEIAALEVTIMEATLRIQFLRDLEMQILAMEEETIKKKR